MATPPMHIYHSMLLHEALTAVHSSYGYGLLAWQEVLGNEYHYYCEHRHIACHKYCGSAGSGSVAICRVVPPKMEEFLCGVLVYLLFTHPKIHSQAVSV